MGRLLDVAWRFLEEDDWSFEPLENGSALRCGFEGDSGSFTCFAQEHEAKEQFVFYSVAPFQTPEAMRSAVAEYLTRANYGLTIGNFEMDYADGEVSFKTSMDAEGVEFTEAMVKNLVYANVLTTDRYLPGLMRVIYGGIEPEEAIREIEE
jgi:hypothetical protein